MKVSRPSARHEIFQKLFLKISCLAEALETWEAPARPEHQGRISRQSPEHWRITRESLGKQSSTSSRPAVRLSVSRPSARHESFEDLGQT